MVAPNAKNLWNDQRRADVHAPQKVIVVVGDGLFLIEDIPDFRSEFAPYEKRNVRNDVLCKQPGPRKMLYREVFVVRVEVPGRHAVRPDNLVESNSPLSIRIRGKSMFDMSQAVRGKHVISTQAGEDISCRLPENTIQSIPEALVILYIDAGISKDTASTFGATIRGDSILIKDFNIQTLRSFQHAFQTVAEVGHPVPGRDRNSESHVCRCSNF